MEKIEVICRPVLSGFLAGEVPHLRVEVLDLDETLVTTMPFREFPEWASIHGKYYDFVINYEFSEEVGPAPHTSNVDRPDE